MISHYRLGKCSYPYYCYDDDQPLTYSSLYDFYTKTDWWEGGDGVIVEYYWHCGSESWWQQWQLVSVISGRRVSASPSNWLRSVYGKKWHSATNLAPHTTISHCPLLVGRVEHNNYYVVGLGLLVFIIKQSISARSWWLNSRSNWKVFFYIYWFWLTFILLIVGGSGVYNRLRSLNGLESADEWHSCQ